MSIIKTAKQNREKGKIDHLIIASRPGMGKTHLLMQLPDCLYIDEENASGHFDGNCDVINIQKIMEQQNCGPIKANRLAVKAAKDAGKKWKFLVIDTASKIDEYAESLATYNYKNSTLGGTFTGESVFELSHGAGYGWHRKAFQEIIDWFTPFADTVILVCHVKDSVIKKDGNEVSALDIRLTGALKEIVSSKQDAAAILNMDDEDPNKRYLDFTKTGDDDFIKCRPQHLANRRILISEKLNDGSLKTYWHEVFLNLSKKVTASEQS